MVPKVKKEREDSVETQDLLALKVQLVKEVLQVIEVSLVLMDYLVRRVHKEIVA